MAKKSKKFLVDIDLGMNQMYNVTAPTQSGQVATYEWVTGLIQDEAASRQEEDQLLDVKIADIISNTDINAIDSFTEVVDKINGDISAESNRAQSAEVVLQANIDVEKGRIDAILSGSDVNLDQFKEVVDFVNSIDLTNDEALMNAVINIENSITQETSDRESAYSALEDMISSLDQTASENISILTSSLDIEISDRISAIETIEEEIADLTESLDSSVMTINDSINRVITDLSTEVSGRISAVSSLETAVGQTNTTISNRLNQVPVVSAFTIGDGILTSFTLEHALGTTDVIVQIFEIATGSTVETESIRVDLQSITIQFSSAPSVDKYRVVAMGIKSFSLPA